jgi:hypothetical protein
MIRPEPRSIEIHLQPESVGLFSPSRLQSVGGQYVQQGGHLLAHLAAAVVLTAIAFCPQAQAQDDRVIRQGTLVAQAGSTGGSVGKKDKSISDDGERASTPDTRSNRSANRTTDRNSNNEESLPKAIQLDEHYGLNYSITLRHVSGNIYRGTWSHGYKTQFTVTTFTRDSIKMERSDEPAVGACTGSYTGSRTGNRVTGTASISNGANSRWDASW